MKDPQTPESDQPQSVGGWMVRRRYARPQIERRVVSSVVMGGSAGKPERQSWQGHKQRP